MARYILTDYSDDTQSTTLKGITALRKYTNNILKCWNLSREEKEHFNLYYDSKRSFEDCKSILQTENIGIEVIDN